MSSEILHELSINERSAISELCRLKRINIFICKEDDWHAITQKKYPSSIAQNDRISLYLSDKFDALLLTTDDVVRQVAKKHAMKYHGILWIFQKLIDNKKIKKGEAVILLASLINSNRFYQQNSDFASEMQKKVDSWNSL